MRIQFQGGSFDAWGPTAPGNTVFARSHRLRLILQLLGYGLCQELTGTDFQSVFNLGLWAANAKMISYYMVYGFVLAISFMSRAHDGIQRNLLGRNSLPRCIQYVFLAASHPGGLTSAIFSVV